MTVKQHHPRKSIPKYLNRILVKGLNPEISEEGLINYLEVKSGESVKDTTYGQEDGTVLVTFEELKGFKFIYLHPHTLYFVHSKLSVKPRMF